MRWVMGLGLCERRARAECPRAPVAAEAPATEPDAPKLVLTLRGAPNELRPARDTSAEIRATHATGGRLRWARHA